MSDDSKTLVRLLVRLNCFPTPIRVWLLRATAIGFVLLVCCGGCSKAEKAASDDREVRMADMKRQVDEADQLWATGEKQNVVERYSAVMNTTDGLYYLDAERRDLSTVASRVIEFKITNSGPESARSEIELAARMWAKITVSSPDGQEFVERVTQDYRQRSRVASDRMKRDRDSDAEESTASVPSSGRSEYGMPRKDETGRWISGEEAHRRKVKEIADTIEEYRRNSGQ